MNQNGKYIHLGTFESLEKAMICIALLQNNIMENFIMKIISHRGNVFGPNTARYGENHVMSIDEVRRDFPEFYVEADMWYMGMTPPNDDSGSWFLAHDRKDAFKPGNIIMDIHEFLKKDRLYLHVKYNYWEMKRLNSQIWEANDQLFKASTPDNPYTGPLKNDVFFHDQDDFVKTWNGTVWVHPKAILRNRRMGRIGDPMIAVLPEQEFNIQDEEVLKAILKGYSGICTDYAVHFDNMFNNKEE